MSILLISKTRNMEPFKDALLNLDSNLDVEIWPNIRSRERINFAVAWKQPKEQMSQYPNLKVVSSLGAGADHLLKDESIPAGATLTRVVAPSLSDQMCDYVTLSVLNIFRRLHDYNRQQIWADWQPRTQLSKDSCTVGVMGLGRIGKHVANRLALNGFRVFGWSKSKKEMEHVTTFSEQNLDPFLAASNVIVCLLPLTPVTKDILNLDLFKKMKKPAFIINVARGQHLVEEDLIYALDAGLINHAVLDVFTKEPLPESHLFWSREKITITPHIASVTQPEEIAELLHENYKRLQSGMELLYKVERNKGY